MKPPHWLPYIWAKMRARLAKLGETTKVDIVAHLCIRRFFFATKFFARMRGKFIAERQFAGLD